MDSEKVFAKGIYLNTVHENAPEFIKANVSLHIEKAQAWLESMKDKADEKGYIRLTGKESKQGKRYFELDTWKPNQDSKSATPDYPTEDIEPSDIPF